MRIRFVLAVFVAFAAVAPGCRCDSAPPEPTAPAPRPTATSITRCPPSPDWAATLPPNADHLLVEIIYRPLPESGRQGTGIRVFDDGLVQTFDDKLIKLVGNKPKAENITPGWRWHAKRPHDETLDALKRELAQLPPAELEEMQGNKRFDTKQPPTLFSVRYGTKMLRSCWLGPEGASAQSRIEEAARKVVGDVPVNEATDPIGLPPPAASSLPKP